MFSDVLYFNQSKEKHGTAYGAEEITMRAFTVLSSLYSEYESLSLLEQGSVRRGEFGRTGKRKRPGIG